MTHQSEQRGAPMVRSRARVLTALTVAITLVTLTYPGGVIPTPFASASAASGTKLAVPAYKQETNEWCWATSAQMAQQFVRKTHASQCQLVKRGAGTRGCPATTGDTNDLPKTKKALAASGVASKATGGGTVLTFSGITTELDAKRPVIQGLVWKAGGGHVVIIKGYYSEVAPWATTQTVTWNDPITGASKTKSFAWFTNNKQFFTYTNLYHIKKA